LSDLGINPRDFLCDILYAMPQDLLFQRWDTKAGIFECDLEDKFHKPVDLVTYRQKMNHFLKNRIDRDAVYV